MKTTGILFWGVVLMGIAFSAGSKGLNLSGAVVGGYREVKLEDKTQEFHFYRGDYVKFFAEGELSPLTIPELEITAPVFSGKEKEIKYTKMKKLGTWAYEFRGHKGKIHIHEYEESHYRAVDAEQAKKFIAKEKPLVLDVRTSFEYARGHLPNSMLIPLQGIQRRMHELDKYKNNPILIYCATGNRSTVASKLLIDAGWKNILNMRYGIKEWGKKRYPIEK